MLVFHHRLCLFFFLLFSFRMVVVVVVSMPDVATYSTIFYVYLLLIFYIYIYFWGLFTQQEHQLNIVYYQIYRLFGSCQVRRRLCILFLFGLKNQNKRLAYMFYRASDYTLS